MTPLDPNFYYIYIMFNYFYNCSSVVSNIEPLDTRSFLLGKLCVCARSRFEKVNFCVLILARNSNARRTFICYLMKLFENVRKSNVRWCSCSKMLENRRSYSLDTQKIRVRHNTKWKLKLYLTRIFSWL